MVLKRSKSSKEYSVKSVLPPTPGHHPNIGAARTQLRPEVHPESEKPPPTPPSNSLSEVSSLCRARHPVEIQFGRGHPFHLLSAPPLFLPQLFPVVL